MDQRVGAVDGLAWLKDRPWQASVLAGFGAFLTIGALAEISRSPVSYQLTKLMARSAGDRAIAWITERNF
ncbi:hypothetical protein [Hyphomicrobium sp. 99]|uniref:hypothetical protein n=1 Tax=Hyphomicrobium sp. 99 TaxID=1163419 RepID=UPI0005F82558|nr:hypothetical protein [Hyphomicrobium sp. 99]